MLWLILLAIAVWLLFQPAGLPKLSDLRATMDRMMERNRAQTRQLVSEVGGMARSVVGSDKTLAAKFRDWLTAQSSAQEFQMFDNLPAQAQSTASWLAGSTDRELRALTNQVEQNAASLGLKLEWLMDKQLDAYPALKQALEQAAVLYTLSTWRASQVREDVKAFRAYQAWSQDPSEQRALGQHLYSALIKQGLVTTSPDLYLAPERERNAEAVKEIRRVAETNPAAIAAIVRDYVTPAAPLKMQAAAQPAE